MTAEAAKAPPDCRQIVVRLRYDGSRDEPRSRTDLNGSGCPDMELRIRRSDRSGDEALNGRSASAMANEFANETGRHVGDSGDAKRRFCLLSENASGRRRRGDGRCMAHNLVATGSVSLRQDMIGTKMQPPVGNGPAAHYERPVSSHSCHDLHR